MKREPMMVDYAELYRRTTLAMMMAQSRGLSETAQRLFEVVEALPPDVLERCQALACLSVVGTRGAGQEAVTATVRVRSDAPYWAHKRAFFA